MQRYKTIPTPLEGLVLIERALIGDSRGYFERLFCADELASLVKQKPVAQINHTLTAKAGTLRGLHYQCPPHAETKLVTCLRGVVLDVVVDVRRNSPSFLRWHSEMLTSDNHRTLVVPEGFAHGFQTLTDDCEMLYVHTEFYTPSAERCINALDVRLGISWPLPIGERSPRDESQPMLDESFGGILL